jgi:hypothetical protein
MVSSDLDCDGVDEECWSYVYDACGNLLFTGRGPTCATLPPTEEQIYGPGCIAG